MKTDLLRKYLLQLAIQGKLVPQQTSEGTAQDLVDNIREHKAVLVSEKKLKKDPNESYIYRDDEGHFMERIGKQEPVCIDENLPFAVPEGWTWARLKNISQSYIGLTYSPENVSNNGVIVLRSSNIQKSNIDLSDLVRVNMEIPDKLLVENGDILICARNGSSRLVGKSAIINGLKEPATFGAFMAICKTRFPKYVYLFLQSNSFFQQIRHVSNTTTIYQLTQNSFNDFLLPLPPLAEQARIVKKVEELQKELEEMDASRTDMKKRCDLTRKMILQQAIKGALVPQQTSEGTAQDLVDNIREEKAVLVSEKKLKKDPKESYIYRDEEGHFMERIGKQEPVCIDNDLPFAVPEGWTWSRLGEIGEIARGGSPRPIQDYLTNDVNGLNWIKIGDAEQNGKYINHCREKISPEGLDKTRFVHKGDFLLTNSMSFGRPYITNIDGCIHDGWLAISWYVHCINIDYIYFLLSSDVVYIQFSTKANGTTVKNLNKEKAAEVLLPLPPLAEQARIVKKVEELLEELEEMEKAV